MCPYYKLEHLLGICLGVVLLGTLVVLCPTFLTNLQTDFQSDCSGCNPSSRGVFLFLHILASICCHLSFALSHSYRFCGNLRDVLICISLIIKYFEHFFKCFLAIQYSSLSKSLFSSVPHFLIGLFCSLDSKFLNSLYILDISSVSGVGLVKICLICWFPFCPIDSRWCGSTIIEAGAGG